MHRGGDGSIDWTASRVYDDGQLVRGVGFELEMSTIFFIAVFGGFFLGASALFALLAWVF